MSILFYRKEELHSIVGKLQESLWKTIELHVSKWISYTLRFRGVKEAFAAPDPGMVHSIMELFSEWFDDGFLIAKNEWRFL